MTATLTHVRDDVYRINHPQFNAALTKSNGHASDVLLTRIFNVVPVPETAIMTDIEFRRGRNTKHWYFELTHRYDK